MNAVSLLSHHELIENYFKANAFKNQPLELYEPVNYILSLKGKRIRPLLVLAACELFEGTIENSLSTAYALEVFHNFTLVHDDIMDQASIRRGQATVHEKFGANSAILSGDVMLMHAYQYLLQAPKYAVTSLIKLFTDTGIQIVEGQQMDMNFENRNDVSESEYLKMIEFKTSVLLAACLQSGAIVANASLQHQQFIYQFGLNLGLSFQIKDDYLDAFGDEEKVGKIKGGDIRQNKKSFLLIAAFNKSNEEQKEQLLHYQLLENLDEKVAKTLQLLKDLQIDSFTLNTADYYFNLALKNLEAISIDDKHKYSLRALADAINNREY